MSGITVGFDLIAIVLTIAYIGKLLLAPSESVSGVFCEKRSLQSQDVRRRAVA